MLGDLRPARGLAALVATIVLAPSTIAAGTFPGSNGVIAFTSGSTIVVVAPDGSGLTPIVSGQDPSWNADGTRIAYSRGGDLYVAGADGSGEVQITSGAATDMRPSWSPDGTRIAFTREESGPPTDRDIAVVDLATLAVTEIVTGTFQASHPAWSPDGTTIAYRSNQSGCASSFCIYLANPDGTGQTELVDSATFPSSTQPSWSPDGAAVVFVYDDDPAAPFSGGLAVVSAAGGTPTALTGDPTTNDRNPVFSPDGTRIAFVRSGALFLVDPDGTNASGVPGAAASDDLGVSWAVARAPVPPEPPALPVTPPVVVTPTFAG